MKYLLIAWILTPPVLGTLLSGCGREQAKVTCNMVSYKTSEKTFGSLEPLKCPDGDVMVSVIPNYIAGGIVSSVLVVCGQVKMECK